MREPNLYSILKIDCLDNEELIEPISFTFLDVDVREIFSFSRASEGEDIVWKGLEFLKERCLRRGGITEVYSHRGSQLEHKLILDALSTHGEVERLSFPQGTLELAWQLKKGARIVFKTSLLTSSYKTLDEALMKYGMNLPEWFTKSFTSRTTQSISPIHYRSEIEECLKLCFLTKFHHLLVSTPLKGLETSPLNTLASTSVQILMQVSGMPEKLLGSYDNREFYGYIREATYGGRNEVYKRYGENLNHYDYQAFYDSCYDVPIPIGKMRWESINLDKATLCEATVKVPRDWYIGPLPYRDKGRGIIIFPVGEFSGWWDARLLREAVQMGVDVKIRRQLNCEEIPILKAFGDWILSKAEEDTPRRKFWNELGVIFHGKTLQHLVYQRVKKLKDVEDHRGWIPLHKEEVFWESPFNPEERPGKLPPWHHPEIGMRIEAEGQRRHLKMLLEAHSKGDIFYCDTDSIFTSVDLPHVKEEEYHPGELELEGRISRGYFIRQKVYGLVIPEKTFNTTASGLTREESQHLTEEDFKGFLSGDKEIIYERRILPSRGEILSGVPMTATIQRGKFPGSIPKDRIFEGDGSRPIVLPHTGPYPDY